MPDIIITEFMDEAAARSLSVDFDTVYDATLVDRRGDLLGMLGDARGLIVRNLTRVDTELLEAAPQLVVVGRLGVGLDNIDLEACEERSVQVRPATGANADAVAEYVIAAVLTLVRGVFLESDRVIVGDWPRIEMTGIEVAGKALGLVGLGDIARRVASRASAMGMRVLAHDPYVPADDPAWDTVERAGLHDMIKGSDAISIHVPLTAGTKGLFDREVIESMKPGAVLVNTARGGIVDEQALTEALRENSIRGAAIDVFDSEPVDPAGGSRFSGVPNLILTPHIAGVTVESNRRVSQMTADHVRHALEAGTG